MRKLRKRKFLLWCVWFLFCAIVTISNHFYVYNGFKHERILFVHVHPFRYIRNSFKRSSLFSGAHALVTYLPLNSLNSFKKV